jgi:hypothetical protein
MNTTSHKKSIRCTPPWLKAVLGAAALLLLLAAAEPRAAAQTTYLWITGNGNWSATGDWSPSGPPPAGSAAYLGPNLTFDPYTVNFNEVYSSSSELADLFLSGNADQNSTLSQTSSSSVMYVSGSEIIGYVGDGVGIYIQSSGSNVAAGTIYVGDGGTGEYELSGSGMLMVDNNEQIGSGNRHRHIHPDRRRQHDDQPF